MSFKINLKSLQCPGCKTVATVPASINDKSNEFATIQKREFFKNPEIIDKTTKNLRAMTAEEKAEHLDNIDKIMLKIKKELGLIEPNSTITQKISFEDNLKIEYEFTRDYNEAIHLVENKEHIIKCKNCDQILLRAKEV